MTKIRLLFILQIFPIFIWTQISNRMPDRKAENWLGANIDLKINNHWKFTIENQSRFSFSNNTFERNFTEFQIEEDIAEGISWGLSYRYIIKNPDYEENIKRYNRYNFYCYYKHHLDTRERLNIKYKIQSQRRRETFVNTNKHVGELRKYWRIKTVISYNIKNWKLDPKIGLEFFLRKNNHPSDQYNKYRFSIGTKKKMNKNQSLTIKYMFEKEYKLWNPELMHIIGIKYNFSFNHQTKSYLNNE